MMPCSRMSAGDVHLTPDAINGHGRRGVHPEGSSLVRVTVELGSAHQPCRAGGTMSHEPSSSCRCQNRMIGLRALGGTTHTGAAKGLKMPRSYDEIMQPRRDALPPEVVAQGEVLKQAYDIAVQVMRLRDQHGLTQAELAERCGIDQADISRIERGSTSPTARALQRIADTRRRPAVGGPGGLSHGVCRIRRRAERHAGAGGHAPAAPPPPDNSGG
ncbi:MAG: hypothetical protein JWM47_1224 [Acidimicrobiales bacterium]|nr:hypothetical protein [Acidimicrobiales bacterium]